MRGGVGEGEEGGGQPARQPLNPEPQALNPSPVAFGVGHPVAGQGELLAGQPRAAHKVDHLARRQLGEPPGPLRRRHASQLRVWGLGFGV